MTDQEKIDKLRNALSCLMTDCDYRPESRFVACGPTEMVGAVIKPETLKVCDEALAATAPDTGVLKEGSVRDAFERQHRS